MSRRPIFLLVLALASAGAACAVWLVAFAVPGGRALDAGAMQSFTGVARPPLEPSIRGVAVLADPAPFLVCAAAVILVALLRRRWLMAAVVPAVLLGANVATQVLKPALADPRALHLRGVEMLYPGSWPSGHSTASMSLALCLVLVVGPRLRPLAAVAGAAYAIGVGYALVALGWHLPSDVVGGYLVAATFTLLGAAGLAALEARAPVRPDHRADGARSLVPVPAIAVGVIAALALAGAAVVAYAPGMTLSALGHPAGIAAGAGIAAFGLALTAGLAAALRR
ncbi:MAG TPA: phosphatase PAP2 family protein [Solirubrobacteraceae bacterium]|nr:phosphatase PAP2 family protein [Solirubrobacteraceae bacterium]